MANTLKWPSYVKRPSMMSNRDVSLVRDIIEQAQRPVNVHLRTFMDEYEYNRAHIAENPEAFEDNIRTILTALA